MLTTEAPALYTNPSIAALHSQALAAASEGNFETGHRYYRSALFLANGERVDLKPTQLAGAALQRARLIRDESFASGREALYQYQLNPEAGYSPQLHHLAITGLYASLAMTSQLHNEARREQTLTLIRAEHGATCNALGRLLLGATLAETGGEPDAVTELLDELRTPFDEAEAYLMPYGNGYYRVSNALTLARLGCIAGADKLYARALLRAEYDLAWTQAYDPVNYPAALHTAHRRLKHTRHRNVQTAVASVFIAP